MKVIIAGSIHMPEHLYALIDYAVAASKFKITEVVSGTAKGADTLGELWAFQNNIPVKTFEPNWDKFGKAAGPIRNGQMKDYADAAIVFIWDRSRGSANMIAQMKKANKPVFVVENGYL
jgi:hypothetical protein